MLSPFISAFSSHTGSDERYISGACYLTVIFASHPWLEAHTSKLSV